ncbi:membrane protein [Acrocarpospora pleiomorpha]|uniref:Membrane protein n=1 Tax=Acrocarpospora pleiomorpha TaxID=90975 RepID=A0A5M3Y191_9ACTN|nr:helix-turn-helix domain-containing protein [Acrocarpospora pleiomorpha]GES27107.1 membrane protein [Acrocarpospora pleiomorpha]
MSIGAILAEARQQSGLSVAELSERTRIREAVINAVERDDYSVCGGDFYARGHLRSMAKELNLDPEAIVREYNDSYGGLQVPVRASEMFKGDTPIKLYERRTPNWTMAMAIALGIAMVFGLVRIMGSQSSQTQTAAKAGAAIPKAPAKPAPALPLTRPVTAVADLVTVKISATSAAWVNVRDVKGKILYQGMMASGDSETFKARKKIKMTFGDAGAMRVVVNGKDLGAPGRSGQTVRRTYGPGVPRPR